MRASLLGVAAAAVLGASFTATFSLAGGDNTIYIRQESPAGSLEGNTLSVDQSGAYGSLIIGPTLPSMLRFININLESGLRGEPAPALQRGEGNKATVVIEGEGGVLQLLQDTSPFRNLQQANSNTQNNARVDMTDASLGGVIQLGTDNTANLRLTDSTGLIAQFGTELTANLTVGTNGDGRIVQIGNRNNAQLDVPGGTSATYTQIGNNLSSVQPVEVFSTNSGNITITQTGF